MITSLPKLLQQLSLKPEQSPYPIDMEPQFPFLVSRFYAELMEKGDWFDPLFLQVVPRMEERVEVEGFNDDAVGDLNSLAAPSLLHKYKTRALLLSSSKCAGNCRFCFRRCIDISSLCGTDKDFESAFHYLQTNTEIEELVLSGGEPMLLSTSELSYIFERVKRIEHIRTLRIHSRLPVTMPSRFDTEIISQFSDTVKEKRCLFVLHVNHSREMGSEFRRVIKELLRAKLILLSQTVLLKSINDSPVILEDLFRNLVHLGIMPYYLHQIDKVRGVAHFEVDETNGVEILMTLRKRLQGYAVPRYVMDVEGLGYKKVLA